MADPWTAAPALDAWTGDCAVAGDRRSFGGSGEARRLSERRLSVGECMPLVRRLSSELLLSSAAPGGPEATRTGLVSFFAAQPDPFGVPLAVLRLLRFDFGWSVFGKDRIGGAAALDGALDGASLNSVVIDELGHAEGSHALAALLLGPHTVYVHTEPECIHTAAAPGFSFSPAGGQREVEAGLPASSGSAASGVALNFSQPAGAAAGGGSAGACGGCVSGGSSGGCGCGALCGGAAVTAASLPFPPCAASSSALFLALSCASSMNRPVVREEAFCAFAAWLKASPHARGMGARAGGALTLLVLCGVTDTWSAIRKVRGRKGCSPG
jgi:hypothetical protein